jgi:DNA processing protein
MEMPILELNKIPKRLKEIPDSPRKLYIKGKIPSEDYKWLCVVGSRKYSPYGKQVTEKLIASLRGLPVVIISGLAIGIDSIAHECALENNLLCVGVPGSGLDDKVLYPSLSKRLGQKIIENGGCLLSEFEPIFKATTWSFPKRNRVMAGLADAVLVVEAEIKSGTLITSKLATDYNRQVLTVPGSIFSANSEGPNMLIGLGATPITNSNDLKEALGFDAENKNFKKDYKDCSEDELFIIEILKTPMDRDSLIETSKMNISKINSLISVLEIKGIIKEEMGEIRLV